MRQTADEGLINSSVRFVERLNLVYLNNPKVACSTIKASMWTTIDKAVGLETYKDNPHALVGAPFVPDIFACEAHESPIAKATWFSVVVILSPEYYQPTLRRSVTIQLCGDLSRTVSV